MIVVLELSRVFPIQQTHGPPRAHARYVQSNATTARLKRAPTRRWCQTAQCTCLASTSLVVVVVVVGWGGRMVVWWLCVGGSVVALYGGGVGCGGSAVHLHDVIQTLIYR